MATKWNVCVGVLALRSYIGYNDMD